MAQDDKILWGILLAFLGISVGTALLSTPKKVRQKKVRQPAQQVFMPIKKTPPLTLEQITELKKLTTQQPTEIVHQTIPSATLPDNVIHKLEETLQNTPDGLSILKNTKIIAQNITISRVKLSKALGAYINKQSYYLKHIQDHFRIQEDINLHILGKTIRTSTAKRFDAYIVASTGKEYTINVVYDDAAHDEREARITLITKNKNLGETTPHLTREVKDGKAKVSIAFSPTFIVPAPEETGYELTLAAEVLHHIALEGLRLHYERLLQLEADKEKTKYIPLPDMNKVLQKNEGIVHGCCIAALVERKEYTKKKAQAVIDALITAAPEKYSNVQDAFTLSLQAGSQEIFRAYVEGRFSIAR